MVYKCHVHSRNILVTRYQSYLLYALDGYHPNRVLCIRALYEGALTGVHYLLRMAKALAKALAIVNECWEINRILDGARLW